MSVGVVVPLTITDLHRARAWEHVAGRLVADGWPLLVGEHIPDLWCKAIAVEVALQRHATQAGDILVVLDADCLIDLRALREAVTAVEDGAAWAIPHSFVHRLTERATDRFYETGELAAAPELVRWPYLGVEGGGAVVLRRDTYDACPLDAGFIGWGDEDVCWGWALHTLYGPPWRHGADLFHLWHPHAAPGAQHSPRWESERLRRRYMAAREDPARMRALVSGTG